MKTVADAEMSVRAAAFIPTTYSAADQSVDVVFSTGARALRMDWASGMLVDEELEVSAEAIDFSRVDAGVVQCLDTHSTDSVQRVLGLVTRGWVSDKPEAMATIRLSQRADLQPIIGDIVAGVLRSISVGYRVTEWLRIEPEGRTDGGQRPLMIAKRWAVVELSFVPVPLDPGASVRGATNLKGSPAMSAVAARAEIDASIRSLCATHRADPRLAEDLIQQGATFDQAGVAILEARAAADAGAGRRPNVTSQAAHGVVSSDRRELMMQALSARLGVPMAQEANPYRHHRVVDLARECLEHRGVHSTTLSPGQIIERALHTTGDFPELLTGAGQRSLRHAYSMYQGGLRRACKKSTAVDFRTKQRLMLGEAPELKQVNEHGEFTRGSMAEAKASYALNTFGRIFGLSRQAMVNDDLDAFADMTLRLGRAAAEFEAKFLVTLLQSNPTMGDGVALFHTSHANLATGGGSALQQSALSAARLAMRLQKGLDGKTPIDASPKFLIVPAALEHTAEQLLAAIVAASPADVNPFSGKLDLIVDPRLDAASAVAWYLASDPMLLETIEYSYLDSANGPEVIAREGFEIDGIELKVRLDYGAGVMDHRGLYKANGA